MGRRIKKAVFKFRPFSKKQKKILTWWLPNSPVHDQDGIIADGAIRSGKTVSMCLSFAMWAMETFNGQNFGMWENDRFFPEKRTFLVKAYA